MSAFSLVEWSVVINLDKRPDRLDKTAFELERVGWGPWQRLSAFERTPPFLGFNRSQIEALKICANFSGVTAILEDDVYFPFDKTKTQEGFSLAMSNLPRSWEVLYLGGMIFSGKFGGYPVAPGVVTAHGLVCTQAMVYNAGVPAKILKAFDQASIYSEKRNIYDCFLANYWHHKGSCFLVNPMIAWQHAGYSDLSNAASVGTGMFQTTQLKINEKCP